MNGILLIIFVTVCFGIYKWSKKNSMTPDNVSKKRQISSELDIDTVFNIIYNYVTSNNELKIDKSDNNTYSFLLTKSMSLTNYGFYIPISLKKDTNGTIITVGITSKSFQYTFSSHLDKIVDEITIALNSNVHMQHQKQIEVQAENITYICKSCNKEHKKEAKFCPHCGQNLLNA